MRQKNESGKFQLTLDDIFEATLFFLLVFVRLYRQYFGDRFEELSVFFEG